ncbi:MAG: DHHA1 domain-containing protein [Thermoproteota archaeon]
MSREHTAEHVLMGSLQRIKGSLKVRKVEFSEGSGSVIVETDSLSFEELAQAQAMANRVISENRSVKEHFFNSLEEAHKAFPTLRAHEERIQGRVRVVEVDGFDYSACSGKHVEKTGECGMILVAHVSKSGGEYRVDFEIGEKALETAVRLSTLCLSISSVLGSPIRNLEKTIVNIKMENEDLKKRLSAVSERMVDESLLEDTAGSVKLYSGFLKGVDVRTVMKRVGELVEKNNSVYVIGLEWAEACSILVGSGDKRVNAAELVKQASKVFNGKGGGDQRIAIGSFPCGVYVKAFEETRRMVREVLSRV